MDIARYAELFLTESREHLSAINHSLLELERTSGAAEPVDALFRAVHTVKGMSATMGYVAVTDLSHELETLLDRVRRGDQLVTPPVMDLLFEAADALEASVELAVEGRAEEANVTGLVARLRAIGAETAGVSLPAAHARSADAGDAAAARWTITPPPGVGLSVRVRIVQGTPLRGVRAFLVVQKARSLGDVTALSPSLEELQSDGFDHEFALRLDTGLPPEEVERVLLGAGDVDTVSVSSAGPMEPLTRSDAERAPAATSGSTGGAGSGGTGSASETVALRQQRHVRIDLRRLDALMNLIGELVITRGRLTQLAGAMADPALDETVAQASRLITDLQDEIMTSRMVPVGQIFDRFPRLVRDAARTLDKDVEFAVEGKDIELDRSMLDEIGDPIVHLLRNAVDHGIELPAQRVAAGKPAVGRLVLSAQRDRAAVLIRVSDDGKGIDRARVLARAKKLDLLEDSRTELTDDELIRFISRSGFSTAEQVTDISGRGVGIDAVQARVRALGGSVEIRTTPGTGTAVTVRLPLTLAIVRALLAGVGGETYALPLTHVNETVELDRAALRTIRGKDVFVLRDEVLPLLRLRDVVQLPRRDDKGAQIVVLEVGDRRAGLVVDELTGQQEIVVKQFDAVRDGLALFSGATILGDGAPALIVDVSSLL